MHKDALELKEISLIIERRLEEATAKYVVEEYISSDVDTIRITKDELIDNKYIDEIYDLKDNTECDAYVIVSSLSTLAKFDAVLTCSNYVGKEEIDTSLIQVVIDLAGGYSNQTFDARYPVDSIVVLKEPIRDGYIFKGWTNSFE